jgi:hypothetical protein
MRHGIVSRSIITALACVLIAAPVADAQSLGTARPAAHEVSIEELLGSARVFDGQPVRLIGVADLSVEFEARPKLYFSREAFTSRTYQYLDVHFSDDWAQYEKELEAFDGHYVIIEGIFHYEPPSEIDVADERGQICIPTCPTSGWLDDINFVDKHEYR